MKTKARTLTLLSTLALLTTLSLIGSRPAAASEIATSKKLGIGGMLGAPTGLSMKYYLSEKHALDFGVGLGVWGGATLYVHGDYKFHIMLTRHADFDLPLYFGVGAKLTIWFTDHNHAYWGDNNSHGGYVGVGVRVPVGIAFNLNKLPLDVFLEVVPGLGVFPGLGAFLDGAVGVRYYF